MTFKFEVGKTYKTQSGNEVTVLNRAGISGYECLNCSDGMYRYDRSNDSSDAGRVTGTAHDYSCPDNFERSKEKPTCQECGLDDISFDAACRWDVEKQDYVLTSTFDSGGCSNCGQEFKRVNWEKV